MVTINRLQNLRAQLSTVPPSKSQSPRELTLSAATVALSPGESADDIECLDYAYSFICNPGPGNAVRFWVESRTIVYDDREKTKTVIYQCASCKSENTFGATKLFAEDNCESDTFAFIQRQLLT